MSQGIIQEHQRTNEKLKEIQDGLQRTMEKAESVKALVDSASVRTNTGEVGTYNKPIMEYKAIQDMSPLKDKGYKEWKDTFYNNIEQVRPGYEVMLKFIEKNKKSEISRNELEEEIRIRGINITYEKFKRELNSILIDKTEGEARGKIKSVEDPRDGINAFRVLDEWFTRVSGLGLAEKRAKIMTPEAATKEDQVVQKIEAWEREIRELKEIDEEEFISEKMKITGIQQILTGSMKESVGRKEWGNYQ